MLAILTILTGALAAGGAAYVLYRPRFAILLVLLMFPLEQLLQTYFPIFAVNHTIINIVIGSLVLFAAFSSVTKGERPFEGFVNPVFVMLVTILAIDALGLLWTPAQSEGLSRMTAGLPYYILMLILAPLLIKDLEDFRRVLLPLLAISIVLSLLLITNPNAAQGTGRLMLEVEGGKAGMTGPLALGTLGGLTTIIAIIYTPPIRSAMVSMLRLAGVVVGFGLALASGSRGQVLAAVLVCALFFPVARQLKNPRQFFINAFGVALAAAALMVSVKLFIGAENEARWSSESMTGAVEGRFERSLALIEAFLDSPAHWLFGLGPQAYIVVSNLEGGYVHNQLVEILCESGLIAFFLYGLCILYAIRRWKAVWRLHRGVPQYRSAAACFAALFVYDFVLSLKQGTHIGVPLVFMWLVLMTKACITEEQVLQSQVLDDEPDDAESWEAAPGLPGIQPAT